MSRVINGEALTELRKLPDKSVDMCVTSPPYYGLRDYGVDGQIGLEETPRRGRYGLCDSVTVNVIYEIAKHFKKDAEL